MKREADIAEQAGETKEGEELPEEMIDTGTVAYSVPNNPANISGLATRAARRCHALQSDLEMNQKSK